MMEKRRVLLLLLVCLRTTVVLGKDDGMMEDKMNVKARAHQVKDRAESWSDWAFGKISM